MANELATLDSYLIKKTPRSLENYLVKSNSKMIPAPSSKMTFGEAVLTPAIASKVLGVPKGMTPGEQFRDMYDVNKGTPVKMSYPERFGHSLAVNLGGEAMDMATSPINYAIGPALKYGGPIVKKGLQKVIGGAQGAAREQAIRMAKNIIKPTGKYAARGEKIAETALEEGVLSSSVKKTAERAQGRINQLMDEIDELAASSDIQADLRPAFRSASASAKYWIKQGKPERAEKIISEIRNIAQAKRLSPNAPMSVSRLTALRRSEDEALKRLKPGGGFYSETLPADIEARQAFAGGMRKSIAKAVPEIGEKNKTVSRLIDVGKVAEKRSGVSGRNEALSLGDILLGAAGTISPKAWGLLVAKKAWQGVKGPTARALYGFSKIGAKPGAARSSMQFADEVIPEVVGKDVPQKLLFGGSRKLLPAPRTPITTSIPKAEFGGPKQLRSPYYIEQSPILFGEAGVSGNKVSMLKKMGINPFTGEMKYGKPSTTLQKALERSRQIKK